MMAVTPQEAAALLRQKDKILILTHRRPDGDTIGCAVGLCLALRQLGKTAFLLKNPDITQTNAVYAAPCWAGASFQPEFVVSVDVAARSLFFPAAEAYIGQIGLAVDHHPSFEGFGACQCVDTSRAACGEIIYDICLALGEITPQVALPLYVAVSTDTGGFVYANTTSNTHRVAAALMETGIDAAALNKRHFRTKSAKRLALEADLLSNMEFFHDGQGVFLTVPISLMEHVQATEDDLRTGENQRVNATCACQLLGGGGHAMAAGATIDGPLPEVKARVLEAINQVKKF